MADFDKSTFDPKAAAEARKQELEEITKKLEKGVKEIFTSEGYRKYLNFCAKLPRYSVNNQILIMQQKPDATMCQSFGNWRDMNRYVKKGEKGIRILAPAPYKTMREQEKKDEQGNVVLGDNGVPVTEQVEVTVNAFKPVSTFDVSQTEGDPIPSLGVEELMAKVENYEVMLSAIKETVPVQITFEEIPSGAKGYYSVDENRIVVQKDMSEAQTLKTLLHEACHQALHSKEAYDKNAENKSKNQKETEAESVAYVVCQHFGIDTSDYSFGYVAGWSEGKEVPELKASLDTIRRCASDLIVKIEEKLAEKDLGQEKEQPMEVPNEPLPFEKPTEEMPAKKQSVMEKLAAGKEMAKASRQIKPTPDKKLEEVI